VEGATLRAIADRVCTSDMAEQGLDPGESRTEVLSWPGWVLEDGELVLLPSGACSVRGAAGSEAFSRAGQVTVQ
jgi:hypothetical protein